MKTPEKTIESWNWITAQERQWPNSVNDMQSMTVPNQTLSARQILDNHRRGIIQTNAKVPIFAENIDEQLGIDIRKLDLSEIHDLKQQNKADIAKIQQQMEEDSSKRSKQAVIDAYEAQKKSSEKEG